METIGNNHSIKGEFFKFTSLAMLSMLGQSLFIFADTFFIALGVGVQGIASLNIVLPMINVVNGIGWMFGVGGATLFAIAMGKGRSEEANRLINMTVIFSLISAVILAVVIVLFADPILRFLGANDGTFQMSKSYYLIFMSFSPIFIINYVVLSFLRNDNNPRLATIALLTGGIMNIILDYIFIFPLDMGLAGAAIATVCSPITSLIIASRHWRQASHQLQFRKVKLQLVQLKDIASLGFSSFFNEFSSAMVMFLFNIVLLQLVGNIAVSAYGIIANLNVIVIALFTGLGQGFQPLASQYFGQQRKSELKQVLKLGLITAAAMSAIVVLISFFFPEHLVSIFNNDQNVELAEIALKGIPLYFASFIFTGVNFVVIYFLSAINEARSALILSAFRGFILIIPVLFIMSWWFDLTGVWLTMIIVELLTFALVVFILRKVLRRIN